MIQSVKIILNNPILTDFIMGGVCTLKLITEINSFRIIILSEVSK